MVDSATAMCRRAGTELARFLTGASLFEQTDPDGLGESLGFIEPAVSTVLRRLAA